MRAGNLSVYIVDDDASVRDSLALMLGLGGYRTVAFADAESLLAAWHPDWIGCVVTDLRLPGMSGIELQGELRRRGSGVPVVVITAHGDVPSARAAFRAQAVDFLEKPFDHVQLRQAIDTAFALEQSRLQDDEARRADAAKLDRLTPRERQVLERAAQGLHAKEIAAALGISPRTVEVHKTRIMEKLGVRNIAELVRFALAAGRDPG
ncbi:MAG TPA: response regulator [Burkholderiales bacterium]|nr:response regulator [Burkholderiales bacterium]